MPLNSRIWEKSLLNYILKLSIYLPVIILIYIILDVYIKDFIQLIRIFFFMIAIILAVAFYFYFSKNKKEMTYFYDNSPKRFFLVYQLLFALLLFITTIIIILNKNSTEISVISWSMALFFLLLSGIYPSKNFRYIVFIELIILIIVFSLPELLFFNTYHGAADLYYHLDIINKIINENHIPESIYDNWPIMHIGISSISFVTNLSTKISTFLFVGISMLISVPIIASISKSIIKLKNLGIISSILLFSSPIFLVWWGYLTPTSLCFCFFTIIIWTISRSKGIDVMVIFIIFSITLIFSHHLSSLIVVTILLVGVIIETRFHLINIKASTMNWRFQFPILIGIIMLTYWISIDDPFFGDIARKATLSFNIEYKNIFSLEILKGEAIKTIILSSLWISLATFSIFFMLFVSTDKKMEWGQINIRILRTFSVLSLLILSSYVMYVIPIQLFKNILFFRWAFFGSLFFTIVLAIVIIFFLSQINKNRLLRLIVFSILLINIISIAALASPSSLPFKEQHFGASPRPYFLDSEESIGEFISYHFQGSLCSDQVFRYYFFLNEPISNINIDASINSFYSKNFSWVIRYSELADRGLIFSGLSSSEYFYLSIDEINNRFQTGLYNCIADTGSTKLIISY